MTRSYKFVARERERQLGILFGCVLISVFIYGLVAEQFPTTARIIIGVFGAGFLIFVIRACYTRVLRKSGPALVGALSPDERCKARYKLRRNPLPHSSKKPNG